MRLVSWNVNGLRAALKKNFQEAFEAFDADVFAIQETKLQEGQVELNLPGYHDYWSYALKKGYSGTAVFSKRPAARVLHGLGDEALDQEGRICALEFPEFWFVDVYTPNAQPELARIDHRMRWDDAFRAFCKGLEAGTLPVGATGGEAGEATGGATGEATGGEAVAATVPKPVVMCGDFNVAHTEIDLKNPKTNRGNPGFSDEERGKFTQLIDAGFLDTFRLLHPDETDAYTWWSYRSHAREKNIGWRIDYFLVSAALCNKVTGASIFAEVTGSDHCPIMLTLDC